MNEKASSKTIPTKTLEELSNRFDEIISRLRFPGYFKLTENDVEQLRKEKNGVWVPEDVFRQKLQQVFKKAEVICYAANGDEIIMYDPKILKELLIELEQKRRGENHKDE